MTIVWMAGFSPDFISIRSRMDSRGTSWWTHRAEQHIAHTVHRFAEGRLVLDVDAQHHGIGELADQIFQLGAGALAMLVPRMNRFWPV